MSIALPLASARRTVVIACSLALFANRGHGEVLRVEHVPGAAASTHQWDVLDLRFPATLEKPVDVEFSATFTHSSGDTLRVPGFYDGSSTHTVRFTAPKPGLWRYQTQSSAAALDGHAGHVQAAPARANRRGGIGIDASTPRRFHYENGERYFPIAFECDWLFALDAEDGNAIPRTRQFVDTLAKNGFNQIVLNVFAYDVRWEKDERLRPEHEFGSPRVFPFAGTNESPQHDRLNVEYFQRLDRVIDYLDEQGIAAHLMIYVWNKRVQWPAARSTADNRYFDYVVRRYQAFPNLAWDISKEALGYGHNDVHYISERIERLRQRDAYQRLVTVHDYGYCRRFPENVDFVSVQLWNSELHSVMRNVLSDIPGKPILNIEHGGYERGPYVVFTGNYTSPEVCLERCYQCIFAGTYPTHYWQGAAWNVIVPDIASLPEDERPRLDYYRHMRALDNKFALDQLIAGEKKSNAGFSLHNGKDLYLYYVPKECDFIGLRLPKEFQGRTMTGTWFNPFTGSYTDPESQVIPQWPAFEVPPGEGFRVLIVRVQKEEPSTGEAR